MMKNLDEPRRREQDVIQFEHRTPAPKETTGSILPARQLDELRGQWATIQSSFVDEPRNAVADADKLVASTIKQIEEMFAAERANLEKQWSRGDKVSTEDLRVCLQHYRDFFDRLLSRI
jgi:hypothetical protein